MKQTKTNRNKLFVLFLCLFSFCGSMLAQADTHIQVGDIFYADGSISKPDVGSINAKQMESATNRPIGVVYFVEDYTNGAVTRQRGWVTALKDACDMSHWGDMDTDQKGIPNYSSRRGPVGDGNEALTDTAGYAHTRYMNSNHTLSRSNYPGFYHALSYKDGSTAVGAGLWYLPSAGQLCKLFAVKDVVTASFDVINSSNYGYTTANKMIGNYYWSSSEFSAFFAWDVRWDVRVGGKLDTATNKGFNGYVRSSCSFLTTSHR